MHLPVRHDWVSVPKLYALHFPFFVFARSCSVERSDRPLHHPHNSPQTTALAFRVRSLTLNKLFNKYDYLYIIIYIHLFLRVMVQSAVVGERAAALSRHPAACALLAGAVSPARSVRLPAGLWSESVVGSTDFLIGGCAV